MTKLDDRQAELLKIVNDNAIKADRLCKEVLHIHDNALLMVREIIEGQKKIAETINNLFIAYKDIYNTDITFEPCDYCKQKGREYTPECELNK